MSHPKSLKRIRPDPTAQMVGYSVPFPTPPSMSMPAMPTAMMPVYRGGWDMHWGLGPESRHMSSQPSIYAVGTEIHFTAGINDDSIEKMIQVTTDAIVESLKSGGFGSDKLEIVYIVDSPGGSVSAVLKFVDFIRMTKKKHPQIEFISIITGLVASAGTIMCAVADRRYMTKYAFAMIHELSTGHSGQYTHLVSRIEFATEMHRKLVELYTEVSKKPIEEIEGLLRRESWYTAEQYLEAGFVDEIR